MAHKEIDLHERRQIERLLNASATIAQIAAKLERHRSSIYREVKRNRFEDDELPKLNGYYGVTAQQKATECRSRRRKLIRLPHLLHAVIEGFEAGWSPEQIAGRMRHEGSSVSVCHETIYAYVYSREGQSDGLARYFQSAAANENHDTRASHAAMFFLWKPAYTTGQTVSATVANSETGKAI